MFPGRRARSSATARSTAEIDAFKIRWCTSCRPINYSLGGFVVATAAPDVLRSAVLIFSEDPLTAALIGAAVELAGFEPAYPMDRESPREALLRKRPPLVLVESGHADAGRASFFGPALMTGARVMLFSSRRAGRDPVPIATRFGLSVIRLPATLESIAEILETELESARR
jgi:hypothetical protein